MSSTSSVKSEDPSEAFANALTKLSSILEVMSLSSSPQSSSSSASALVPITVKMAPKLVYKRTSTKLGQYNFIEWDHELQSILFTIGYVFYITEPDESKVPPFPANEGFEELNSQLYVMMEKSMKSEIRALFVNCPIGNPRFLYQAIYKHFVGNSQAWFVC